MTRKIDIEESWKLALAEYFDSVSFVSLANFVRQEYLEKKIYPKPQDLFKAFRLTPLPEVKVVILGQDPYHGAGQAHGLCFSVPNDIKLPPSLVNIYKEIESDLGIKKDFNSGSLESWAEQGVLLLNAILTVEANQAASHQRKGWEEFTDTVIKKISDHRKDVVFLLWGAYAQSKAGLIDNNKHLILQAPHPSPLSVYRGFFGCKHFSKTNNWLLAKNLKPINWEL